MDNIHIVKEKTLAVEKKPPVLVLQYPYKLVSKFGSTIFYYLTKRKPLKNHGKYFLFH